MNADGSVWTRLTASGGVDGDAAWSPDGFAFKISPGRPMIRLEPLMRFRRIVEIVDPAFERLFTLAPLMGDARPYRRFDIDTPDA